MLKKQLILEDGTIMIGKGFGSESATVGEVVFNTGMTGYQETITDPSYCGQIVTFTYPLIGNYGINRDDFESVNPVIKGVVVKEAADYPVNWRSEMSIDEFLKLKNIPGIAGIDTRKLTRIIRSFGTLKGAICTIEEDAEAVIKKLQSEALPNDQVQQVSIQQAYPSPGRGHHIVLVDFGAKHGILRELNKRNCDVTVVPFNTRAETILAMKPDGVMLSNGPGDPKDVKDAIVMIQQLIGKIPLFGICLGHQLFALACGADTYKMKFGHRGSNHPVRDLRTGKVALTSQNHGYAVSDESLVNTPLVITQRALNDGTIEGLEHKDAPAFTVQYHPEASPGPEDTNYLFDEYLKTVAKWKEGALHHA
jgi:carbamoyl-phosphate synthase small subunit